MQAIQASAASSGLFPSINNKFKSHDSPVRNKRELSLPGIKINQMNNVIQSSSSLKKYKKIKYLGKGSYGAALLVCLRYNFIICKYNKITYNY